MTKVIYYITIENQNPTRKFIESLSERQQRKIIRILTSIQQYGLTTAISHTKKLTDTPLWEIRILGQDNIRVLYATILVDSILLVHGFIKKTQQTPKKEVEIALSRLKEWLHRKGKA